MLLLLLTSPAAPAVALALDGGGTLTAAGTAQSSGTAALDGGGALTILVAISVSGSGALDGGGLLTLSGAGQASGALSEAGGGLLTISGHGQTTGTLSEAGGGLLTILASPATAPGSGAISGGGILLISAGTVLQTGSMPGWFVQVVDDVLSAEITETGATIHTSTTTGTRSTVSNLFTLPAELPTVSVQPDKAPTGVN